MKNKICIVTASNGKNLELAESFMAHLSNKNIEAALINIVEYELPLYSRKAEDSYTSIDVVAPFKDHLEADAYIFVAPEYNGSTPPAFANFVAWVSRSTKNWRDTFNGKTALIATASAGPGVHVLMAMRMQLAFIGMNVIGRQAASTMSKPLSHDDLEKFIDALIASIPQKNQ